MNLLYLLGLPALSMAVSPNNNTNHIFNAIHSSMRQWGSSLNHNGMSFFLASVPEGTTLYHGSSRPNTLVDIGWMAFDPEHALVFARPPHHPKHPPHDERAQQKVVVSKHGDSMEDHAGWLHTYQTIKELRLVYVDGMSAGKSHIGTLDSQDRILFNDTIPYGGVSQETERSKAVCRISAEEWDNRIDGVIRMAGGFEIILCAPEENLVAERVTKSRIHKPKHHENHKPKQDKPDELLRVVTSRYNGIGGDRVKINYDHFVSVYDSDLNVFPANSTHSTRPRLAHLSKASIQKIRQRLTDLVMDYDVHGKVNWRAVADMTVQQYGRRLPDLVSSPRFRTMESLKAEIARIWESFIDLDYSSPEVEIQRCTNRFIPHAAPKTSLAHNVTHTINEQICSTLATVLYDDHNYVVAVGRLQELIDYLSWTVWKECRDCRDDEFCAIPIWPQGSLEDYEDPRCQRYDSAYAGESDYWGPIFH